MNDEKYVTVRSPSHPKANSTGRMYQHILIAERALCHFMPDGAAVHHIDENPKNNDRRNIIICQDNAYHLLLHARMRRLRDTGSLDLRRCKTCGIVKPLSSYYHDRSNWDNASKQCRQCAGIRLRNWKRADRKRRGVKPKCTLTVEQVRQIKERCRNYYRGLDARLGRLFNVGHSAIRDIRIGKTWKGVQ